jgi:hypothetical protein
MRRINLFLREAKNVKCVGKDGCPIEFWKNDVIGKVITKIMNKVYETEKFLTEWKTSLLHVMHKGEGDKGGPGNYRGVLLILTLSKIYTGVPAEWLNGWFENRGVISESQMAFRKGRRTTDNIVE